MLLLELLRDEIELDVVGRVRVFVDEERLTLDRERDELELELERLTLDRSRDELVDERLTLDRERDELELEVAVLYFGRELEVAVLYFGREVLFVLDENDRFEVVVGRL